MAREFAKPFYDSARWKKCRAAYISRRKAIDGGMCETCKAVPGYIVHHKVELSPENINDPDIALGFDNLKYDCHICHNKEGKEASADPAGGMVRCVFDENGELRTLPPEK